MSIVRFFVSMNTVTDSVINMFLASIARITSPTVAGTDSFPAGTTKAVVLMILSDTSSFFFFGFQHLGDLSPVPSPFYASEVMSDRPMTQWERCEESKTPEFFRDRSVIVEV